MLRCVLVCLLIVAVFCDNAAYETALKSRKALRALFKKTYGHKGYSKSEINSRLGNFKSALELIVGNNKNPDIGWESDLNFLADLSPDEKKEWLGAEITHGSTAGHPTHTIDDNGTPTLDWVEKGYVRPVEDQTRDCKACWAFAAIAAINGRYQITTGSSSSFSVQEFLDCVYYIRGRDQDGCYGGQMTDAFDYVTLYGRLATKAALPYSASSGGTCEYDDLDNGLEDAKLTGHTILEPSDKQHIDALIDGPIAVAVQTTNSFLFYSSGVFKDETCATLIPNHAVAMVGYTKDAYRLKNSWGANWGDQGYMYAARGHHGCGMMYYSIVPTFEKGAPDTKDLPGPPDACTDDVNWANICPYYSDYCMYYSSYCAKTCNEKDSATYPC